MTTGEKLAGLRRDHHLTQEQLAEELGVTRQAVGRWEADAAFPETEKLIRISKLYHCSLDYLLTDDGAPSSGDGQPWNGDTPENPGSPEELPAETVHRIPRVRTSDKMILGMPLWQIGKNAHAFFAVGVKAKGVFAVGVRATGIFALGVAAFGVVSLGTVSAGLLAMGMLALGVVAGGTVAVGAIAAGALALGMLSFGAIAAGDFAVGASAWAEYGAMGFWANGTSAGSIGAKTMVDICRVFQAPCPLPEGGIDETLLRENVPTYLMWAKNIFSSLIH